MREARDRWQHDFKTYSFLRFYCFLSYFYFVYICVYLRRNEKPICVKLKSVNVAKERLFLFFFLHSLGEPRQLLEKSHDTKISGLKSLSIFFLNQFTLREIFLVQHKPSTSASSGEYYTIEECVCENLQFFLVQPTL